MGEARGGHMLLSCDSCGGSDLRVLLATHDIPAVNCASCGRDRPTVHEGSRLFIGCGRCRRMNCAPCVVETFLHEGTVPAAENT